MTIRLIALCLTLLPATLFPGAAPAQQTRDPGACEADRACPAGQVMDGDKKTCVDASA